MSYNSLPEIQYTFDTQDKCLAHLEELRWGGKPKCPRCASAKVHEFKNRAHKFMCYEKGCRFHFSVMVGTVFENSKLPLPKWFVAIWLYSSNPDISTPTLAKTLQTSIKSAYYIREKMRYAAITPHSKQDEPPIPNLSTTNPQH